MCYFFFQRSFCTTTVIFQPVHEQKSVDELCSSKESVCVCCVGGCDVDRNRCSVSRNSVCKERKESVRGGSWWLQSGVS